MKATWGSRGGQGRRAPRRCRARVAAGGLLARLDDQDQRNAVRAAESDVVAAKALSRRAAPRRSVSASSSPTATRPGPSTTTHRGGTSRPRPTWIRHRRSCAPPGTLSYTELRADRAGVISAKGAEAGQVVASGQMAVRLADPSEREAVFQVPAPASGWRGGWSCRRSRSGWSAIPTTSSPRVRSARYRRAPIRSPGPTR